jgi:tRNA-dihydrouridine synthase B
MMQMAELRLGNLVLDVPFFQAALSGYSDWAMRKLAREFGCPLALTGVMLAKSAVNPKVLRKIAFRPSDDEHPVGAQILSRTPAVMAQAAQALIASGYDLIDLNFACPAPKVLRRGRGGALLDEPDLVIDILKAVQDAVDCPIIMKLRIGVNRKPESQANFWQIVEQSVRHGVNALVIHGRTVSQRYRATADWAILAQIKRNFPQATIIGSGDVFNGPATKSLLAQTGLDGVVIARGAVGNPWIFSDFRAAFENSPLPAAPNLQQQKQAMLHHFDMVRQLYNEKRAVGYFRKFAAGYTKRHPQRKKALLALMAARTQAELQSGIHQWYD